MSAALSGDLLLLSVVWPLLPALLLAFRATRSAALYLAPWAALPALAASLLVAPSGEYLRLPRVLMGSELGLDATGQTFLLLTALLWTVAGLYAWAYFPQPDQRRRFYLYFLLAMSGNLGLTVAQDLPGFYFGFTLMSFASYGLVIFKGNAAALRAGRIYIALVVVGELLLFMALLLATQAAGAITFDTVRTALTGADNRDLVILLALTSFGIKAGVLGLHLWLPLAHPVAPTPASAVLSGAMIKAGLLGWLRLLPMGEVVLPGWGVTFIVLGLSTAFYGVVIGLTQREPKTLLAYSSISQMGVMTLAVGLGMLAPQAWPVILPGIAFYALHHGLSKGALFLGVSIAGSKDRLQRRWIWLGLWLPALALAGAPWSSGMLAKHLLKTYTLDAPPPWDSLLPMLLSASAGATALLMARLLYLLRPAAQASGLALPAGMLWPWTLLLLTILLTPWWLAPPTAQAEIGITQIIGALWPLLLALIATIVVLRMGLFRSLRSVPAGDLLVPLERGMQSLQHRVRSWIDILNTFSRATARQRFRLMRLATSVMTEAARIEVCLIRWGVAIFFVVMIALCAGLLASIA